MKAVFILTEINTSSCYTSENLKNKRSLIRHLDQLSNTIYMGLNTVRNFSQLAGAKR